VPELIFFHYKSNTNTSSIGARPILVEKEGNSSISRVIALIAVVFWYKYYKKDSPVVTPVVNEFFDFEAVKKYTSTSDQQKIP